MAIKDEGNGDYPQDGGLRYGPGNHAAWCTNNDHEGPCLDGLLALATARSLLGQVVKVTLDHADPMAHIYGRLLAVSDGGEFTVQDEMGFNHYCWPMLDIEAVGNGGPDGG